MYGYYCLLSTNELRLRPTESDIGDARSPFHHLSGLVPVLVASLQTLRLQVPEMYYVDELA